jgi:hypothetical protein
MTGKKDRSSMRLELARRERLQEIRRRNDGGGRKEGEIRFWTQSPFKAMATGGTKRLVRSCLDF